MSEQIVYVLEYAADQEGLSQVADVFVSLEDAIAEVQREFEAADMTITHADIVECRRIFSDPVACRCDTRFEFAGNHYDGFQDEENAVFINARIVHQSL